MNNNLDLKIEKKLITAQKAEITGHHIYKRLAEVVKNEKNRAILQQISADKLKNNLLCNDYTCQIVQPNRFKIWLYYTAARLFGVTFGLKLMERSEEKAHDAYAELTSSIPEAADVVRDEERYSKELLDLIDDERIEYSSDIVRGLSVALIEMSGALAGFTFALQQKELVMTAGVIIGVTTSLSIIATEFLATRSSTSIKNPFKSALYAGMVNVMTVVILLLPYIVATDIFFALGLMIVAAVIIIYLFSFYLSVVRDTSTIKMFLEMASISLGIATLAFAIGFVARDVIHIHI